MRKAFLTLFLPLSTLLGQSLCMGDPHPKSACAGWEALSQLGSLMPERIWEQEFDVMVDTEAFQKAIPRWTSHARQDKMHPPRCTVGHSSHYFLQSTMSGDHVRIIDRYQEFQWSPFWKNPPRMAELRSLEQQVKKEGR